MQAFNIALRNIFRNRRRTLMAMMSIIVGVVALALISGFVSNIRHSLQTAIVRSEGHVQIMAEHYLDLGSSNPGSFYVEDWQAIAQILQDDPELAANIRVIAPMLAMSGVVGNAQSGASRSFRGVGYVPALYDAMQGWNDFDLEVAPTDLPLDTDAPDLVLVGLGLAEQLQICAQVAAPGCTDYALRDEVTGDIDDDILALGALVADELTGGPARYEGLAMIDLMASSADGAPNARSVWVKDAIRQARRESDNAFVAMDLRTAQNLVYEQEDKVSQIMVQFHSNAYAETGVARIRQVLADYPAPLDVVPLSAFNETFTKIVAMFGLIQVFIGVVVGLIILFMIANTMAIVVMERVNEIGTIRSLGETRMGVLRLFLFEGVLLGVIAATLGLIVSWGVILIVNNAGLTFVTPSSTQPLPLRILFLETPLTVLGIWLMIIAVATVSSLLPARRAARFRIVDALRFS